MRKPGFAGVSGCVVAVVLLVPALFPGGCQFIDKAKIQQKMVAAPINMKMIYLFDQYEASIRIDASAEKVWSTFIDPGRMARIFSAFDTLAFSPETGASFSRGTHFGYTTRVAGEEIEGTAVVTNFSPGRFFSFAILDPWRNVTTVYMKEDRKGKTRVWIHMTMRELPQNMAVTSYDIRQSLNASLRKTLKTLKRFSEETDLPPDTHAQARIEYRSEGLAPFEIIHFCNVFPVGIEKINRYFLADGAYARVLQELGLQISSSLQQMLELPGTGVPFSADVGPFSLKGIALVTEMIPDLTLNLSTFHSRVSLIKGGANLRFISRGNNQTEMQLIEYYQIPDMFQGESVDKEKVKAELKKKVAELAHLTEWIAEKRPPRAFLEKRPTP